MEKAPKSHTEKRNWLLRRCSHVSYLSLKRLAWDKKKSLSLCWHTVQSRVFHLFPFHIEDLDLKWRSSWIIMQYLELAPGYKQDIFCLFHELLFKIIHCGQLPMVPSIYFESKKTYWIIFCHLGFAPFRHCTSPALWLSMASSKSFLCVI